MKRFFIVNDETKKEILHFTKAWTHEFPRVIVQITGRTDGYLITIDGPEEEVSEFISKLNDNGVELDT
jgi:hypothetical protein